MRRDSLQRRARKLVRIAERYWVHLTLALGVLLALTALVMIFAPQQIAYSFSERQACTRSPRLLPQLSNIEVRQPFELTRPSSLSVGSVVIYSNTLCVTAVSAPHAASFVSYKEWSGWRTLGHSLTVQTPHYAKLQETPVHRELAPDGLFTTKLDRADTTFTYALKVGDKSAPCTSKQAQLQCDLTPLALAYSQQYDIALERQFNNKVVGTLATAPVKTITPTSIVSSSITAGAQVQQKPTELNLQADKTITALGAVTLVSKAKDGTETVIPSTAKVSDKTITVAFGQELARKATFEVRIASVTAADGSGFVGKAYALGFSTSGGPRVTGTNIGTRNVGQGPSIAVTFDQVLLATQAPGTLVSFTVHGKPYEAAITMSGSRITIVPRQAMPLCAPFTITVTNAVQNQYGVSGDSAWRFNSRTTCYTTFSIGSSVRGRGITAYQFGSGANPIVYIGAMHGSESNTKNLMNEWFNELNANPGKVGARSLVVIPSASPDGVASGSRYNARGVDLNRNFPANDWKSMVTSPENPNPSPAGGPSPLSEPESSAIASYIQRVRPRLVISFHSAAAVVEANEAGDSTSIANGYASRARYRAVPKSQSAPIFKYDTTGAMEDWMRDRLGSPAIVVELLSKSSSEFGRNRNALWYTTGL